MTALKRSCSRGFAASKCGCPRSASSPVFASCEYERGVASARRSSVGLGDRESTQLRGEHRRSARHSRTAQAQVADVRAGRSTRAYADVAVTGVRHALRGFLNCTSRVAGGLCNEESNAARRRTVRDTSGRVAVVLPFRRERAQITEISTFAPAMPRNLALATLLDPQD